MDKVQELYEALEAAGRAEVEAHERRHQVWSRPDATPEELRAAEAASLAAGTGSTL